MSIDRQEPLRNLGMMVARIRATSGTGRLALRNTARVGMLHLYFDRGQLVQLEGSRASIDDALIDLVGWNEGLIRFDNGVVAERQRVTPAQRDFFQRALLLLQQHGILEPVPRNSPQAPAPSAAPQRGNSRPLSQTTPARRQPPPVSPEGVPLRDSAQDAPSAAGPLRRAQKASSVPPQRRSGPTPGFPSPASPPPGTTDVLLSARQWTLLVEVVRAILESVGRLFGQRQAQNILQHVLTERGAESAVLGLLQVDRQGGLREVQSHEMQMQPVQDVAAAFVLLISDFEYRCAALLGEEKARQMIAQALYPYYDDLAEIGIVLN